MVEQALVDVADLLDVQGAEGEAARLGWAAARHFHLQDLQRFEQVQHGAVVDRQRLGGRLAPGRAGRAPFQEREAVGVEEVAAVGGQAQILVLDAAVDGAEGGQQAAPGVVPPLQHLFAVLVGRRSRSCARRVETA